MSVAKKEEVCSHPLVLRLGEPAVGVPIKKRPVLVSDKSVPSGMPLSMKPSSTAKGMSVSAAGPGCSKEPFMNRSKSDTNVIPKCNGITNPWDQNHAVAPSVTENKGVLAKGSSEIPSCGDSGRGSVAPLLKSQCHKFLTLDFKLASQTENKGVLAKGSSEILSCGDSGRGSVAPLLKSQSHKFLTLDFQLASQNAKINYSSLVKKEKVDQGFLSFSSAEPPKDFQTTSGMKSSSNSSLGKLPNLDLNVPLDPADHLEGLPTVHEGSNILQHRTVQHQKAQVLPVAPVPTISSRLSLNIDSTLNLSNAYGLSNKRGAADVTLDLQLKPPTRPEIGINWKGLAPDPELSLSLSGNHTDEPKDLSAPGAVFKSEPAKKVSGEVPAPGSDKSPVENFVKPPPCSADPPATMPSTVSGNVGIMSRSLVKNEPEEPPRQHIQSNVEKVPLFEQQVVGLVSNFAESEKTSNTNQILGKAGVDLNSENFPNNTIHKGMEVGTDSVPVQTDKLCDFVRTETITADSNVEKFIKNEEFTTDIPSPVIATLSGQSAPLVAKSLPLEDNVAISAVKLCESASQPPIYTSEPACYNPVEANTDCRPTVSHVHAHEDVTCNPCADKETRGLSRSSSNPTAESLVFNPRGRAAFDGMSQGSASMDCSDDGDNAISQLPTTNMPHVEPLGNSQIAEASNLSTELQKEDDSDMHHDCSSVTNKVHLQGIDNDKCVNAKDGSATHLGEDGRQSEVSVNGIFKEKQLLTSAKNSPVKNTDVAMQDVKVATGVSSTDLRRSSALGTSASPKYESSSQSHKSLNICLQKSRSLVIKSERSQSPHGKQATSCSEGHAKIAAGKSEPVTENEQIVKVPNLQPRDSVLAEDSHLDGASSGQPQNECTKVKSACERSEHKKSKPDSSMTSSVQNEKDGQVDGSHWRANTYVNRNERWERFMESEREKNKGEHHGGRHASDMINQRRTDHRFGGRGAGYHGHPRNFRVPRMGNESEIDFAGEPIIGRRRPFEDDLGHLHRIPHRRRRSPPMNNQMPGCLMREMDHDRFSGREIPDPRLLVHGQMEDLPDDMMEERFFIPHSHPQQALGDHAFIHRDRSHSPGQRRGVPMHFHRGRSPEAMHRSPPLSRTDRPYLPQRHTRRRGSPFDRIEHDERDMQRSMRRCGMHHAAEGDTFEQPLHPAQLAELHAEAELTERRKFGERRMFRRSLEENPVGDDEEMLSYHREGDMDFTKGDGGPLEPDGHFRNRLEHRARGEQEDGYRYRGPQGWHDGKSSDNRPKRRRY